MLKLILVSNSPRRVQILKKYNYHFLTISVQTSEIFDENLSLDKALIQIAKEKVHAGLSTLDQDQQNDSMVLIGADTSVCLDLKIFGKPQDESQAREYLGHLSGVTHQVKTAVSIYNTKAKEWCEFVETTQVQMKKLNEDKIKKYIETGEPFDKAGGYGIQGKGGDLVESFSGSWYNVVGFPIEKFESHLKKLNWKVN